MISRLNAIIKYLFYSFLGLVFWSIRKLIFSLYHKFNRFNLKHKQISVCGRGLSANKFFKEQHKIHTKLYLANYQDYDLQILDCFKLINKELVIVSNIDEAVPYIFILPFIQISEVIIARPPNYINRFLLNSIRQSYKLNLLGVKIRGIKNAVERNKFPLKLGNTGLLAIYEATEFAISNNIENIYLYGFDFYSNENNKSTPLRNSYKNDERYEHHRALKNQLSKRLDHLASRYPKITYIYYSMNNYDFKSSNILKKTTPKNYYK